MAVVKMAIIHFHFEYIGLRIFLGSKKIKKWRCGALGVATLELKCVSLQCHGIKMYCLMLQVTVTVISTQYVALRLSAQFSSMP